MPSLEQIEPIVDWLLATKDDLRKKGGRHDHVPKQMMSDEISR